MRKVFSSIILVILMLLGIGGCLQKEETAASAVTSIVLTSDKAKITANGTESVTLTAVVKDQNNTTMSGISLDYYAGTTKLANNSFKTTTAGIYKLTAKAGTITSNELTVTAGGNKIEITIDGTGKIKLSPEKEEYENNEEVSFEALPDDYSVFQGWFGENGSEIQNGKIKIDSIKKITAKFKKVENIEELVKKLANTKPEEKQSIADKNLTAIIAQKSYPIIEGDYVTLVYQGTESEAFIGVNDDISSWFSWSYSNRIPMIKIDGTNLFYRTMKYPNGTKLDYLFRFTNKTSKLDLLNSNKIVQFGVTYSEIRMSGARKLTELEYHAEINHGKLIENKLDVDYKTSAGQIKQGKRRVQVYLPYGYNEAKVYKVLYIKDGSYFSDSSNLINQLDYLINSGEMEPVVAVFIDFIDRDADYFISGVRDFYYDYFINNLKPWVEKNYSVSSNRDDIFLIGASLSGFAVTDIALKYSDKIKNVLAFSPSYWSYFYEVDKNIGFKMNNTNFPVKIFISGGEFEGLGSWAKTMYEFLKVNSTLAGLELKMYNYQHGQKFYGDVFKDGILWLMDKNKKMPSRVKAEKCAINVQLYWKNTGAAKGLPAGTKAYFAYYKSYKKLTDTKSYENTRFSDFYNEPAYIQEIEPGKTTEINFKLGFEETNWGMWSVFYDKNGDGKMDATKVNWDLFTQNAGDDLVFLSDSKAIASEDSQAWIHLVPEF